MTATQIAERNRALDARMVAIVARRLGAPVVLLRHDMLPTGANAPVFGVSPEHVAAVNALGLRAEPHVS